MTTASRTLNGGHAASGPPVCVMPHPPGRCNHRVWSTSSWADRHERDATTASGPPFGAPLARKRVQTEIAGQEGAITARRGGFTA